MKNAIILAGGVAKGPFGAGALEVLAELGIPVERIVGSSSGALNAMFYAAGLRFGCSVDAARSMVRLWQDAAHWIRFLDPDPTAILSGRGVSDSRRIVALLRKELLQLPRRASNAIDLRLIVTALDGMTAESTAGAATTYERVLRFASSAFDTAAGVDSALTAAIASAAFPGLFTPLNLPGVGPALDGGMVSNAPVKEAIDDGTIDRVFVIVPYPQVQQPVCPLSGTTLFAHVVDVLLQERLFRDLDETNARNGARSALLDLVNGGVINSSQLDEVLAAIGWPSLRHIDIVSIRPRAALEGGAFSGFFDAGLRGDYLDAGRAAARAAILPHHGAASVQP